MLHGRLGTFPPAYAISSLSAPSQIRTTGSPLDLGPLGDDREFQVLLHPPGEGPHRDLRDGEVRLQLQFTDGDGETWTVVKTVEIPGPVHPAVE